MSAEVKREQLRQRADYTYKFNAKTSRHGWLRLTPAYSLKIVEELLVDRPQRQRVFDPFCGTGTTVLSAMHHGHDGITTDINPFLIWFSQAKVAHYFPEELADTHNACVSSLDLVKMEAVDPVSIPPIHNIHRWWNPKALEFLRLLRAAILEVTTEHSAERTLLMVGFCRTLIRLSNAAFNHQSMSFKGDDRPNGAFSIDMMGIFIEDVQFVLQGAAENPPGFGQVLFGDSKSLPNAIEGPFDLVITSPPYVNRMSYIRELRPYMYWLGFLTNGRDAGELDWAAIGGTWGVATSRLSDWQRPTGYFDSKFLAEVLESIAHSDNRNGVILANYVAKYFDDMWAHFQGLTSTLSPTAEVHYIVGNSTFYGTLVSTELLYAEMLSALGFDNVECKPIRKRNSKKELVEFDVTAKWNKR